MVCDGELVKVVNWKKNCAMPKMKSAVAITIASKRVRAIFLAFVLELREKAQTNKQMIFTKGISSKSKPKMHFPNVSGSFLEDCWRTSPSRG